MAIIILLLLFAIGSNAHQPAVEILNDDSKFINISTSVSKPDQHSVKTKTHQDDCDIADSGILVMLKDRIPVKSNQNASEMNNDGSEINKIASAVLNNQLPVNTQGNIFIGDYDKVDSGCEHPFQSIGRNCYFFSDDLNVVRNFLEAMEYCQSLTHGHVSEITLAMLDYDNEEDQALLSAIGCKAKTYWVGGNTENGVNWKWLDNRDIFLQAPFWYWTEPDAPQNKCAVAESTSFDNVIRSNLYDYNCDETLSFICQIGCPFDFRRIGNYCYLVSEEYNIPHLPWQEAREFCQTLSVPMGYHADLAVLGLPDQDTYHLMYSLTVVPQGYTYIGAFLEKDCDYKWIDGRELAASSIYWFPGDPSCGSETYPLLYRHSINRTHLYVGHGTSSRPFICQMFKDA